MNLFPKKKRRVSLVLQLAPLIDIFMLLIIFLIKGTVIGDSSISMPAQIQPAYSASPETMESAQQVILYKNKIDFKMINQTIEVRSDSNVNSPESQSLIAKLKSSVKNQSAEQKKIGGVVNLISDRNTKYENIFYAIQLLKLSDIKHVLFVAAGDK